jgi:membrane protease YdiL (CAAX protease family)
MSARRKGRPSPQTLYELSTKHNILVPLILLIIAVVFKIIDSFVLRWDELLGELIFSKSIGFLLVVVYLWAVGKSLKTIGLHGRLVGKALVMGAIGVAPILLVSYGVQFSVLVGAGKEPALALAAIDPRTGMMGGMSFALFLIVGNFVNSFMEEGLFRGVMLRHFRASLSFWRANFLQAALFGLWHLNWSIKQFMTGQTDLGGAAFQGIMLVLGAGVYGFAMGYLYLKTDNLWAPWLMHTINNSVLNMVHIRTIEGLDSDMVLLQVMLGVCYIAVIPLLRTLAKRFQTPEVEPWGPAAR